MYYGAMIQEFFKATWCTIRDEQIKPKTEQLCHT